MRHGRRRFLALGAMTATAAAWPRVAWADEDVAELGFGALAERLADGRLTAVALTRASLQRIEELDRSGPRLRSVIETNPEALSVAEQLDAERRSGKLRGPLHGLPILVKDNVGTADRMETTAGSLALVGARPARDAFVAERLRAAGAILLGKANLTEWANFRSTRASSGWSARGGQCRNPYVLDRSPCGSSSGSGAAVAASLCAGAIGTETDGSIVCPATSTGIVGVKPTLGLVSRAGIIPLAHSQDTAGPMTRSVRDAALLLSAIAGADPRDAATKAARVEDYVSGLDAGVKGLRLGVARNLADMAPGVVAVFEEALTALRSEGAVLVDPANVPHVGEYDASEYEVLLYEFKADIEEYLKSLPSSPHRTLADLIAFNEAHRDEEMPYFGQEIFKLAQEKGPLTTKAYRDALAKNHRLSQAEGIDAVMTKQKLDAIVAPTGGPSWTIDLVNGDHFTGSSSSPAAVSGYPAVSVPAGFVHGLPVGITFFGRAWSEAKLLRIAAAFERAANARKPPRYEPTLGF